MVHGPTMRFGSATAAYPPIASVPGGAGGGEVGPIRDIGGRATGLAAGPTQEQALRTTALPVASGVVAGGSVMGVVLVFWANVGSILNNLLGG